MRPGVSGIAARAYARLLSCYPSAFRERYAPEMVAAFEEYYSELAERAGTRTLVVFCARTAIDLFVTAAAERARVGWLVARADARSVCASRGYAAVTLTLLVYPMWAVARVIGHGAAATTGEPLIPLVSATLWVGLIWLVSACARREHRAAFIHRVAACVLAPLVIALLLALRVRSAWALIPSGIWLTPVPLAVVIAPFFALDRWMRPSVKRHCKSRSVSTRQ